MQKLAFPLPPSGGTSARAGDILRAIKAFSAKSPAVSPALAATGLGGATAAIGANAGHDIAKQLAEMRALETASADIDRILPTLNRGTRPPEFPHLPPSEGRSVPPRGLDVGGLTPPPTSPGLAGAAISSPSEGAARGASGYAPAGMAKGVRPGAVPQSSELPWDKIGYGAAGAGLGALAGASLPGQNRKLKALLGGGLGLGGGLMLANYLSKRSDDYLKPLSHVGPLGDQIIPQEAGSLSPEQWVAREGQIAQRGQDHAELMNNRQVLPALTSGDMTRDLMNLAYPQPALSPERAAGFGVAGAGLGALAGGALPGKNRKLRALLGGGLGAGAGLWMAGHLAGKQAGFNPLPAAKAVMKSPFVQAPLATGAAAGAGGLALRNTVIDPIRKDIVQPGQHMMDQAQGIANATNDNISQLQQKMPEFSAQVGDLNANIKTVADKIPSGADVENTARAVGKNWREGALSPVANPANILAVGGLGGLGAMIGSSIPEKRKGLGAIIGGGLGAGSGLLLLQALKDPEVAAKLGLTAPSLPL